MAEKSFNYALDRALEQYQVNVTQITSVKTKDFVPFHTRFFVKKGFLN